MVEAPEYISDVRFNFRNGPIRFDGNGMTDAQFYDLCIQNSELRIERNSKGEIIVMPFTTSETGRRNLEISTEIAIWNRQHRLGHVFDSSTGFKMPNGADRSPDTSWILKARWDILGQDDKQKFAPIVPDFVIELRSLDQSLNELREKMAEYMDCGCRLGWLIDQQNHRTYVYSENGDIQTIQFENILSGNEVMPGLSIRLTEVLE